MGSFAGHIAPGTFILVFGIWWTIQVFRRYFKCKTTPGIPFRSSVTFQIQLPRPWNGRPTFQIEGAVKIFFVLLGIIAEVYTAFFDGKFVYIGNGQHTTMYMFYGLSGIVDLLMYFRLPLPKGSDYAAMILGFLVQAVLFKFHLHGRNDLDVMIHTLLLYTTYAGIVALLAESCWPESVLAILSRIFFVLVQGTWFWQIAFILYNPFHGGSNWKEDDPEEIMLVTMIFAWHLGAAFVFMMCTGLLIGSRYIGRYDNQMVKGYDPLSVQLVKHDVAGVGLDIEMDDESES